MRIFITSLASLVFVFSFSCSTKKKKKAVVPVTNTPVEVTTPATPPPTLEQPISTPTTPATASGAPVDTPATTPEVVVTTNTTPPIYVPLDIRGTPVLPANPIVPVNHAILTNGEVIVLDPTYNVTSVCADISVVAYYKACATYLSLCRESCGYFVCRRR